MMYQMGEVVGYNLMRMIFHQFAMHDQVAFEALLSLASKHYASVHGKDDTEQSLYHKTRAINLLNNRMKEEGELNSDATIYAVGTLAVLEVCPPGVTVFHTIAKTFSRC
jgi:hypothetical protein